MRLNHVALTVADRARSIAFYGEQFGLTERIHDDAHLLMLGPPDGDSLLALTEGDPPEGLDRVHFGFRTSAAEIRAARGRMHAAGVTEVEWQEDGAFVRLQVLDPDGYRVEMYT